MSEMKPMPGKDGNKYVPYGERSGETSVVYFTRDLSHPLFISQETSLRKV